MLMLGVPEIETEPELMLTLGVPEIVTAGVLPMLIVPATVTVEPIEEIEPIVATPPPRITVGVPEIVTEGVLVIATLAVPVIVTVPAVTLTACVQSAMSVATALL